LFDSAFSLSNTGEALAIKNGAGEVEDSVSYISSIGAAGDGGSLQRSNNTFIAALPTLGVFPGAIKPVPAVQKPTSTKTTSSKTASSGAKTANTNTPSVQVEQSLSFVAPEATKSEPPQGSMPFWSYLLGLLALVTLGCIAAIYARASQQHEATNQSADEFEITGV